jgi:hypothetical protein
VWKGETPFEIHEMHARPDGFEFTFTEPLDRATAEVPASYKVETYTYIYQASYGSPEVDKTTPVIKSATLSKVRYICLNYRETRLCTAISQLISSVTLLILSTNSVSTLVIACNRSLMLKF